MLRLSLALLVFLFAAAGASAQCVLPYTLLPGAPADATQVMANFTALVACMSGGASPGGSNKAVQFNANGTFGGVGPANNSVVITDGAGNPMESSTLPGGLTIPTPSISGGTVNGADVTGLPSPVMATDAATKAYVDGVAQGFFVHTPVVVATAGVLPNTPAYANGSSGVGATLTAGGNAALVIDGVTVSATNRVLVKDQAAPAQNGIYVVTTAGSGSVPWVLTRATDFDTAAPGNIATGAYVFVSSGSTNASSSWNMTTTGTIIVGTTGLVWTQFSATTAYQADGSTLQLSGTVFSEKPGGTVNASLASMAAHTYKGNPTGSPATPADIPAAQVTADLAACTPTTKGLVPTPPNDATKLLDGTCSFVPNISIVGTFRDLQTTDTSWTAFGSPTAVVATHGNQNAIVGFVLNDLPNATLAFPGGVNCYGKIPVGVTGNQVFGCYGVAELYSSSGVVVGAEFTARNFSGLAPDVSLPVDAAIGTPTRPVIGANFTCGASGTGDCSIGLNVGNESGNFANPVFNTAAFLGLYRQYGLFIQGMPSGTQTSSVIQNNGNGINLHLQSTAVSIPNEAVIDYVNSASATKFSLRQNGDVFSGGHFAPDAATSATAPSIAACGSGASFYAPAKSTDNAGTVIAGTGAGTTCSITFGRAWIDSTGAAKEPSCTVTWGGGSPIVGINGISSTSLQVGLNTILQTLISGPTTLDGHSWFYTCE